MTTFPPDGDWTTSTPFHTTAAALARPDVVAIALHALTPIFTPAWALATHAAERTAPPTATPHPFLQHLTHPGGVRDLLELGVALAYLGSPPELTHDLTTPSRFRSRSREILAAAYVRSLGAALTYVPEGPGSKRPEFTATLDGSTFAVEVKGLDFGAREHLHLRATIELQRRLQSIAAALPPSRASDVCFELGAKAIASILRNDQVDADAAEWLARELGALWAGVVEEGAGPGVRTGPRDSTIVVHPLSATEGHRFGLADVRPAPDSYVTRLGPRLTDAAKKFAAFALPGIIVLEPPFLGGAWPVTSVATLRRRLLGRAAWTDHVAAVVLSETHAFAPYHQALTHGSDLRILRGKRWAALPRALQLRWDVPCRCCGVPHDCFDLVTLANEVAASMPTPVELPRESG